MENSFLWKISRICGLIIAAVGLFTIWCWIFEQSYSVPMYLFEMTFNSALCLTLVGLIYLFEPKNAFWSKILQLLVGCIVLTLGILVLIQYIFNISLGIDQLFIKVLYTDGIKNPGRLSSLTATAYCTGGLAILMLQSMTSPRLVYLVHVLILTMLFMAILGIVQNEIFNLVTGKLNVNRIAYHTSFCLALFSVILWIHWYNASQKIDFQFTDAVIGNFVKLTILYFGFVVTFSMFLIVFASH